MDSQSNGDMTAENTNNILGTTLEAPPVASMANQALHEYRRLTDESVVNWLAAIKELIERVPNKGM